MTPSRRNVAIVREDVLSDDWTRLSNYMIDYTDGHGETRPVKREIYHRTPAGCILLHDRDRDVVVLVRQFRLAARLAGMDGWMIEVPAGLLDGEEPETAVRREVLEETGYRVGEIRFLFRIMMSPGAVTETTDCYFASIRAADRVAAGGGLDEEHEDIEVLEIPLDKALAMIGTGEICDGKTIMLLQWAALNRASF